MKVRADRGPLQGWVCRSTSVSEMVLIATVAIVFLVLHVLAGTIVQRAAAGAAAPAPQEARSSPYD
jgi:hypothetical protein